MAVAGSGAVICVRSRASRNSHSSPGSRSLSTENPTVPVPAATGNGVHIRVLLPGACPKYISGTRSIIGAACAGAVSDSLWRTVTVAAATPRLRMYALAKFLSAPNTTPALPGGDTLRGPWNDETSCASMK